MAVEVVMPQMGESVVEGTIINWLVKEGDQVSEDQPLVAISTDKVDAEIPSPAAGTIGRIVAKEGETLAIGALLAVIETAGRQPAAPSPAASAAAMAQPQEAEVLEATPASKPAAAPAPKTVAVPVAPSGDGRGAAMLAPAAAAEQGGGPARYSPLVLKMASEHGIDLSQVRGTGLGGRVTKRDVVNYLESPKPAAAQAPAAAPPTRPALAPSQPAAERVAPGAFRPPVYEPSEGDVVEAFSRRRKIIAEHMVYSKTHAPHVGTVAEVDMTRAARFRETHKDTFRQREGFNLTILPMVVTATARALREFPRMNASVAGDALVVRKEINIGVAVDTEEGLLVPVSRGAEQKSLLGIAREIDTLARKAAARQISADELAGGSFTVSNPGREGNLFGLAIINQPQVGILRMGEIKKTPVVVEVDGSDTIAIRHIMYLALSYDHRVIDGVLGNRFLFRVARLLEEAEFTL
jgi:pyruvate/2-oxoglutarate dehydrogenase complex dihydrolipoamide acyltransferase (E2) component